MAIIVQDGGQSSSPIGGQNSTYIVDKILTRMPAAPDALVNSELQDTIRNFYTMSTGWRDVIGPYFIQQGVDTVFLNPVDAYTQIQFVLQAWTFPSLNGAQFPGRINLSPRKRIGPDIGPPQWMWMQKPDTGVLFPVPDKTYGQVLFVYAALLPTLNSTRLPDIATTQHLDALMWGTMARLYRMKGKPWSDRKLADDYQRDYRREILIARDQANRAYSNTQTPTQFPPFAPKHWVGTPIAVPD